MSEEQIPVVEEEEKVVVPAPEEEVEPVTEPAEEEPAEEEPVEEEIEEEEPKKDDSVPLAKYMQEKKKRQEIEKVLAQQQAEQDRIKLVQDLIERGYPEYEAERQAQERIQQQQIMKQLIDKQTDFDIRELAGSDPFYADAVSFKSEIKELMSEKGLDAESAYMLLRGKSRVHEVNMQNEQRRLVKKKEKKVESASPTPVKNPYKLDDSDRKALAELQKAQPEAGWTSKKYYEMMKT